MARMVRHVCFERLSSISRPYARDFLELRKLAWEFHPSPSQAPYLVVDERFRGIGFIRFAECNEGMVAYGDVKPHLSDVEQQI